MIFFNQPKTMIDFFNLGMNRDFKDIEIPEGKCFLNLGAGNKKIQGVVPLDLSEWNANEDIIPALNGDIDGIFMIHFLEHVNDPIHVLSECHRVLRKGGLVYIVVPYGISILATQDLNHKHFFNENTWKILFNNKYYDQPLKDKFEIKFNFIIGENQKNLCLFTQLSKK